MYNKNENLDYFIFIKTPFVLRGAVPEVFESIMDHMVSFASTGGIFITTLIG